MKAYYSIALALTIGAGTSAFAQEEGNTTPDVKEVVVTGTRISLPGVTANSPVATVSAEEIQFRQPAAVEELVRSLPSVAPAIGPGVNNGAGGGATIDLRGMGPNRSLVLIDGRRVVPFNLLGSVDTNVIPLALLERFDLVTGGASAVYGADAVTGVANFILKRNFNGIELSSTYGSSGHSDAKRYRADLTMGTDVADGRGNVAVSVGYTKTDELLQGDRPYSQVATSSTSGKPSGSGTGLPLIIGFPFSGSRQLNPDTGSLDTNVVTYNTNPPNLFVTPLIRTQATAIGHYEITDKAEGYTQLLYNKNEVDTQLASSGTFLNVYQLPLNNPFLPATARQQLCAASGITSANCTATSTQEVPVQLGRRITELGPRLNDFETTMFQYTLGLRGDITQDWKYDVYWSSGESDGLQTRGNWGSFSKMQQALRATSTTTCTVNTNGCVPINLFGPEGSITPEMLKFINEDALLRQIVKQDVAAGSITGNFGDALRIPFASDPIGFAVGVEYRKLRAFNKSDAASQIQGEVLGTGAPTPDRSGTFTLKEAYTEAIVPIVSDEPFAHSVSLELGYRRSKFEAVNSESYGSYKYGGEWAPLQELRFRVMQQRATRSPNINELFAPTVTGLSNLSVDPCQGNRINAAQANTAGTLSNLCRLTGVPLELIGGIPAPSSGQINSQIGGNNTLVPEKADTRTIGVVWQPGYVHGLTVSLDYYKIEVNQAISSPSTSDVLNNCYDPVFNPGFTMNAACQLIGRSTVTGTFNGFDATGVITPTSNDGLLKTDGFDLSARYAWDLPSERWGRLTFGFDGNKTTSSEYRASPLSPLHECAGVYSVACGNIGLDARGDVKPVYKWTQRTTWSIRNLDVSYQWRYIGAVHEEGKTTPAFLPEFTHIPAFNYIDLGAAWQATTALRLNLTVTNLLDKDPPIVGSTIGSTAFNSGNTFPQFYDTIGRYYSLTGTLHF
jgi:outer membrane receptor protein involved in Fe transport